MANLLAIGLLVAYKRPGSRPFVKGFEVFGVIALAAYVCVALLFTEEWIEPYVGFVTKPLLSGLTTLNTPKIIVFSLIRSSCSACLRWRSPSSVASSHVNPRARHT